MLSHAKRLFRINEQLLASYIEYLNVIIKKQMKIKIRILLIFLMGLIGFKGKSQEKTLYMVSNAHLDTQWNWDVQTTIDEYLKNTLNDNFALFKKYPDYKFNFEGAIKYMWFKEYYPEQYAQLKNYIASGQWNISGSSLDAGDVIVPSPESQFRNILIGQTFYKKEFGKKSNDIFLPDCFGFGYTLPTIMNHCGLIGFCTQKLASHGVILPFKIGAWQGVDGSNILAVANGGGYNTKFDEDLSYKTQLIDLANETGSKTNGKHFVAYRLYGTGDKGGAPDDNTVNWVEKSLVSDGPLKVKSATTSDMYNQYFPYLNDFPLHDGELIMTTHGTGCYTSHTMMKRWNRKNEILADVAERSAVMADWLGGLVYPAADLNESWIRFLWHQFHDDLTGTSIEKAYTFSHNDEVLCQKKFSTILNNAVGAGVRLLNTQTEGTPVVVYNPLSIDRADIVEVNLRVSEKAEHIRVFDKLGVEVPAQVIASSDTLVKFIFTASVKSLGLEVYDARPSATAYVNEDILTISENSLENSVYKVTINADGDISSVVDKSNGDKQLLSSPVRLALLTNEPRYWASWEIDYKTLTNAPRSFVDGTPVISIAENGPVRVALKIERTKENSTFVQYIRLTNTDAKKRIDVENEINWKTMHTLLKAVFPLSVNDSIATYDLGLGVIQRPNNISKRYEVPAQQWADITDANNSYGVSILNDCKYGWDKPSDNTLRLSLIHSPQVPLDRQRFLYQENQDLGNNKFTYSIYGHTNTCLEAASTWEAAKLNQPLMAFEAVKHDGNLGKSFSLLSIESSQVALKTLKKAEMSNDYVLRFYETKGMEASGVKVKFASKIVAAKELNGIEEESGSAIFSDSTLIISLNAFQPRTYSVKLASPAVTLTTPESKPLTLPYNVDVITTQANMTDGQFDDNYNSYVAELLPDTIVSDGICFVTGPKSIGKKNALKCLGNKIPIPEGYKKLYILAASSRLKGSTADCFIDNKPFSLEIPYFSNVAGQAISFHYLAGDTTFTQSYFNKENIAWTGNHLHNGYLNKDRPYEFTYLFKYCITLPAGAKELILPNNGNIVVFAVSAANNSNDDTKPAAEFVDIQKQEDFQSNELTHCSELISAYKPTTASGQISDSENPSMAVDGNESTKWCHKISSDKWLAIDLGKTMNICEWKVLHAGIESEGYITKDFKLQKLEGEQWVDVDAVSGNMLNTTDRFVTPFSARKVRLYITNSGINTAARIYEFQVFGSDPTDIKGLNFSEEPSIKIIQNPANARTINFKLAGFEGETKLALTIKDCYGRSVYQSNIDNASTFSLNIKKKMSRGLYFVAVKGLHAEASGKMIYGCD